MVTCMEHEQKLLKLIETNGGKITAYDVAKAEIPHAYLTKLVRENILERTARESISGRGCLMIHCGACNTAARRSFIHMKPPYTFIT